MKYLIYAGTSVDGNRQGIHILSADANTGELEPLNILTGVEGTTYFGLNRAKTHLYTLQTLLDGTPGLNGTISAYAIEGANLRLLNQSFLGTATPCHCALSPDESAVVWADYMSGVFGVSEVAPDGTMALVPPLTVQHFGSGPNTRRQKKAHAHCAIVTPDGKYLCAVDLGSDRIALYDLTNRAQQGLKEVASVKTKSGAGPRHLTFTPDGRLALLINELDSTVSTYRYVDGSLTLLDTQSTLPKDFPADGSKCAAIKIARSGRLVLASNRGHDSIAAYALDPDTGKLTLLKISALKGKFPRDFEILPGEKFVIVGHKLSNEIQMYALAEDGALTPVHDPIKAHKPLCFKVGSERKVVKL